MTKLQRPRQRYTHALRVVILHETPVEMTSFVKFLGIETTMTETSFQHLTFPDLITSAVYVIVYFVVQGGLQDVTIISDASKAENYCYDVYEVSNNHVSHTVRNTDRSDSVS